MSTRMLSDQGGDPRVTVRLPPRTLAYMDWLVDQGHYSNRSEAMRKAADLLIDQERGDR